MKLRTFFTLTVFSVLFSTVQIVLASPEEGHGGPSLLSFLWYVINFVIFLFVLYKYALPKIVEFFKERGQKIRNELEEAENAKTTAEKQFNEYQSKVKDLEKEVKEMMAIAEKQSQEEKHRIIKEAEKEAESIKRQAKVIAEYEIGKAKADLKKELANLSLAYANKAVLENINTNDQERIVKDFVSQLS